MADQSSPSRYGNSGNQPLGMRTCHSVAGSEGPKGLLEMPYGLPRYHTMRMVGSVVILG